MAFVARLLAVHCIELLEDGRIQPARIEEVLDKVRQDLTDHVTQAMGEDAAPRRIRFAPSNPQSARQAALPHQLWAKRAQAHARSCVLMRCNGSR